MVHSIQNQNEEALVSFLLYHCLYYHNYIHVPAIFIHKSVFAGRTMNRYLLNISYIGTGFR